MYFLTRAQNSGTKGNDEGAFDKTCQDEGERGIVLDDQKGSHVHDESQASIWTMYIHHVARSVSVSVFPETVAPATNTTHMTLLHDSITHVSPA